MRRFSVAEFLGVRCSPRERKGECEGEGKESGGRRGRGREREGGNDEWSSVIRSGNGCSSALRGHSATGSRSLKSVIADEEAA